MDEDMVMDSSMGEQIQGSTSGREGTRKTSSDRVQEWRLGNIGRMKDKRKTEDQIEVS